MKKNIKKIIQINTSSSSFSVKDYKEDIYRGWYAKIGFELKKMNPQFNIECWALEKNEKTERKNTKGGILFRTFPTNLSLRHSMEISFTMLKALIEEQKNLRGNEKIILHLHEYHTWQTYLILKFCDKRKIKIIAQHHGGRSPMENFHRNKKLFFTFPLFALMQVYERLLLKKIDIFYVLSDIEKEYLEEVTNSIIKFQTMGISREYFKRLDKNKIRKKLGLSLDKKYVLYIGRIKTTKGIKELLDAMKDLEKEDDKIRLVIIGEGIDLKKYEKYAKEKNINNANFLGPIYGTKKLEYLSACDCLILPSHTEGAPVVIMEALAKNLPIIATDVGGVKKMLTNGKEGIIIETKNSNQIVDGINQIVRWKNKKIYVGADKYLWKKIIKETIKDYFSRYFIKR